MRGDEVASGVRPMWAARAAALRSSRGRQTRRSMRAAVVGPIPSMLCRSSSSPVDTASRGRCRSDGAGRDVLARRRHVPSWYLAVVLTARAFGFRYDVAASRGTVWRPSYFSALRVDATFAKRSCRRASRKQYCREPAAEVFDVPREARRKPRSAAMQLPYTVAEVAARVTQAHALAQVLEIGLGQSRRSGAMGATEARGEGGVDESVTRVRSVDSAKRRTASGLHDRAARRRAARRCSASSVQWPPRRPPGSGEPRRATSLSWPGPDSSKRVDFTPTLSSASTPAATRTSEAMSIPIVRKGLGAIRRSAGAARAR